MKVALLGVGHWHAEMHRDAVVAAGAEISAIWDPDAGVGAHFAERTGSPLVADLEALLRTGPGLIVLMGRPDQVPEVALRCLATGIPLVLEKPAAVSTAALRLVLEAASGRHVAVPLPNRFSPIWGEMARLDGEGRLGPVSHAQFRIVNGPPGRYREDGVAWVLDPAVSGGGALRNLGIHGIDAALSFAPGARVVGAQISSAVHGEAVEEYALVSLRAPDGPVVTVEAGYTYASMAPGGDFEWRVSAGNAYLVDRGESCSVATLDDGALRALAPIPPALRYRAFMADALARIARGDRPAVGIDDYFNAMALIDRAYEEAGA